MFLTIPPIHLSRIQTFPNFNSFQSKFRTIKAVGLKLFPTTVSQYIYVNFTMLRFHLSITSLRSKKHCFSLIRPPKVELNVYREREREGGLHQNKPICASKQFNGNVSKPTARAQISL